MGRSLKAKSQRFSEIQWIEETGSTNRDLLEAARQGQRDGSVLVTNHQTAGRGRQGRAWHDDPGSSLLFSVLLRPEPDHVSLFPLVMGLAVVEAVRVSSSVDAVLKWPNDVLVAGPDGTERKLAGILAEATGSASDLAVVIGCGINVAFVTSPPIEVADRAIDLAAATEATDGVESIDRAALLDTILARLEYWLTALETGGAARILAAYRDCCITVGRNIRLETPTGVVEGTAVDIDPNGALVIDSNGTRRSYFAGDAHHLV